MSAPDQNGWFDIATAPKDRTPILGILKNPLPRPERTDLVRWYGLQMVIQHPGLASDGFDIGWCMAAPVGQGGFPDDWFDGWQYLPKPRRSA